MDIDTMHIEVKQGLDKSAALELPAFEPEEIDLWLNKGIRKFARTRYGGTNPKGTSFEETQKRIDDLRTLIVHVTVGSVAGLSDYPNGYQWDIPGAGGTYWFTLSEEANIIVGGVETRVGVTECTIDEYRQKIDDPYSEHKLHYGLAKPLRLFNGSTVELISDGNYTVDDYIITYLVGPETVDISGTDCDLPEHTHDEIISLTVDMMLENIEQPRYQSHQGQVATME